MTYEWECTNCGCIVDVQRPMADRDQGPEEPCVDCKRTEWKRYISLPHFTRRTFLDGGRKSDGNFQDAKRALQLEVDSARSNSESDKKLMSNEIKALRTVKK